MKYKLLLISLFFTTLTALDSEPSVQRSEATVETKSVQSEEQPKANLPVKVKTRVRVDKNGNRWIFDQNSGEWTHLPQQSNPMSSIGFNDDHRDDDYSDEPFSEVYSPLYPMKGQQRPINVQREDPNIFGPQYPNTFHQNNYLEPIDNPGPIYGPMPPPDGLGYGDEDEFNSADNGISWQNLNNPTQFPIAGSGGQQSGKTSTQSPARNSNKKPSTLEAFEDPFETETEPPKRPLKKFRKVTPTPTTTTTESGSFNEDETYNLDPFPSITSDHLDSTFNVDDISLEPIGQEYDQFSGVTQTDKKPKPKTKKPFRKPIIKVPIGPQEPSFWGSFPHKSSSKSTSKPTTTTTTTTTTQTLKEEKTTKEVNTVELFPPVPPEYPSFIYPNNIGVSQTTPNPSSSFKPSDSAKEVEFQTPSTTEETTTTTTTTSTTTPTTTTTATTPSTTLKEEWTLVMEAMTIAPWSHDTDTPFFGQNENQEIPSSPSQPVEEWKPITLGSKRRQTPVPIVDYPTIAPSAGEVWRPVMGIYNPNKPQETSWLRPSMNIPLIKQTKKEPSTTSTTTTTTPKRVSSTNRKRLVTRRRVVKTTEATTEPTTQKTTTEVPKIIRRVKKIKKILTTKPTITTTTTTTTTTPEPTTTRAMKIIKKIIKRLKIVTTTTTTPSTTVTTPEVEEVEIIDDGTDSEAITEVEANEPNAEEVIEVENEEQPQHDHDETVEEVVEEVHSPEEIISEETNEENPSGDSDQPLEEVIEEVVEEVTETSPSEPTEAVEEFEEVVEEVEEPTTERNTPKVEEQPVEEIIEEIDENENPKPDDNEVVEEIIEEIPEDQNQESKEESNTIEEVVPEEVVEENSRREELPKGKTKQKEDFWQHIVVPIKRNQISKGSPDFVQKP